MTGLTGIGDLTGDGKPDLIATKTADGTLWLYPGGTNALGTPHPDRHLRLERHDRAHRHRRPDRRRQARPHRHQDRRRHTVGSTPAAKALGTRIQIGTSGWNGMKK